MQIKNATDARMFVAAWVAECGKVRPGILSAAIDGTQGALAIMNSVPTRYGAAEREDMREALDYLRAV